MPERDTLIQIVKDHPEICEKLLKIAQSLNQKKEGTEDSMNDLSIKAKMAANENA